MMYSHLFPEDAAIGSPAPPLIEVSELRELLGQHFDFRRLEAIFGGFVTELKKQQDDLSFGKLGAIQDVYFKFDELMYLGKVKGRVTTFPGVGIVQAFTFKLPNDGFLYTPEQDLDSKLDPHPTKDRHNNTPGWHRLATSPIPGVETFVQACLGTQDIHPCYMYNFSLNRLDCKYFNGTKQLSITFEPGYPETPFWDDWIEHR